MVYEFSVISWPLIYNYHKNYNGLYIVVPISSDLIIQNSLVILTLIRHPGSKREQNVLKTKKVKYCTKYVLDQLSTFGHRIFNVLCCLENV